MVRSRNTFTEMEPMENYLSYLWNVVSMTRGGHVQPVYGIALETSLPEGVVDLPGYRGMGPVRVGNQAYEHFQYDVYGNIVLGAAQAFFLQPFKVIQSGLVEQALVEERLSRSEHNIAVDIMLEALIGLVADERG